jgi:arabinan endo-1,5-alpha-L-arabinosidase
MKKFFLFLSGFTAFASQAQQSTTDTTRRPFPPPVGTITTTRQTPVHDPVMTKEKNTYYLFCTGNGISVYSSHDLKEWRKERPVFSKTPEWVTKALPNYRGNSMWAPDVSYYDGKYYLFYAVSAFGKNTSCIGLVVNKTLDSSSADYKWEDKGKIIQSVPGRDMWNAIDPNLIVDENKTPWLAFGSFWNGM